MQCLGQRFGQPIGQCFDQNRAVIVVLALEVGHQPSDADAGRDGESAQVVGVPAVERGDKIGQGKKRRLPFAFPLLPQGVAPRQFVLAGFARVEHDVVAGGIGSPEAIDRLGPQQPLADDAIEHFLGVGKQRSGRRIPTVGSSKMRGYFPLSSHDIKKGDQSINGSRSTSG